MREVELGDEALRRHEAIALLDPVGEHAERRRLRRGERDGYPPALAEAVAGGLGAGNAEAAAFESSSFTVIAGHVGLSALPRNTKIFLFTLTTVSSQSKPCQAGLAV